MVAWIIAVVVAIGLIWSVAAMSNLLPMDGSIPAAISRPAGRFCCDAQQPQLEERARSIFKSLRNLWIAIGDDRALMTPSEFAEEVQGLCQLEHDLTVRH
jgi:hypothetical protein